MATDYEAIKQVLSGSSAGQLMSLRQSAQAIKDVVVPDKMSKDPVNAVVENMSRESQDTAKNLQSVINPTKLSAPLELKAQREAEALLGDPKAHLDIKKFGAFEGLDNNANNSDFSGRRSVDSDMTRAENQRLTDLQSGALGNGVYATEGGFTNGTTTDSQQKLMERFGIKGDAANSFLGKMAKECIPCGLRPFNLKDIQFSNVLANTIKDLKKKLEELKRLLDALFLGNQAEMDLCDLLRMLEAQCLPDLFGMLSLLGIMNMKYLSGMDFNMKGALNSIIAPFLSPIIGPLVHNLERYVNMIVDPLICVVDALETQMYKITSIDPKAQMDAYKYSYNRKQIEFYQKKVESLEKREKTLRDAVEAGEVTTEGKHQFPRYTKTTPFPNTPSPNDVKGAKEEEGFVRKTLAGLQAVSSPRDEVNRTPIEPKLLGSYRQDIQGELDQIKRDRQATNTKMENLIQANERIGEPKKFENSYEATKKAKEFKKSIQSSIYQMTLSLNQGIQGIKDTLEMYRIELERTITGRVQTQEDLIELTRNIQQIQRWISIVNALIKLKKSGGSLSEICKRGTSTDALGAFAGEFKKQPNGDSMDFYGATDDEGNELLVIAPGGTTVNVTSIEFEDLGSDALLGQATLNDVQKTVSYNDLNEANKLNKKGMLLDLGNISGKDLTVSLSDAGANKTDLDLRAERSYVIIKNDFCSKSPFKTGTSDSIRKWAENIL
jgi:hypothetical protein